MTERVRPIGGNASSSARLELWACDAADASQQWRTDGNGALVNKSSGLCMDLPWASTTPGTRIAIWTCNQGPNQKWVPASSKPIAGTTQAFTYDAEGRTETVTTPDGTATATSKYLYDTDGGLLIQRGPDGTVLYLFGGSEQLTMSADGTTVSGKRYYYHPDGTAVVRSSSGALNYELNNPQNTSALQVDAATKAITRRAFDPYGNPRGAIPTSWADNRGYLGKPVDTASGLNLLGARNYDPTLGRFLTVDPVLEAGDPNQMSGYTYAANNPVSKSDPTGLAVPGCNKPSAFACDAPPAPKCKGSRTDCVNAAVSGIVIGSVALAFTGCEFYSGFTMTPECVVGLEAAGVAVCGMLGGDCPGSEHVAPGRRAPAEDGGAPGIRLEKEAAAARAQKQAAARRAEQEAAAKAAAAEVHPSQPGGVPTTDKQHSPKPSKGSPGAPATPKAKATAPHEPVGSACSFTPDTQVLMADGSTKPIGDIKAGDRVEAADQVTAADQGGQVVTATWVHDDEDLVDLDITIDGSTSTIATTANHPFWDETDHTWVPAGMLTAGHTLSTNSARLAVVAAVRHTAGRAQMHNLTVNQLHTYYVLAGNTPVLVHNTCGEPSLVKTQALTPKELARPGFRYQVHVTGQDYEQVWEHAGRTIKVDGGPTSDGFIVEAKWTGNDRQWGSSPYNPSNYFNESSVVDQARKLLGLNSALGGSGVRYAISNREGAAFFGAVFREWFPEEIANGTLSVWHVPGNGM
ncbi:polymorphic toxin-type HINT domain-containing protein [Kitasatospora hibisci]|uniref:polymorphic toxin-type HINT domain-containing protein n=1 Tax=Kitasatospora hibisci TaxID=3369522 RepID=UPI0037542FF5